MIGREFRIYALRAGLNEGSIAQRMEVPFDRVRQVFRMKTAVPKEFITFVDEYTAKHGLTNFVLTGQKIQNIRHALGWSVEEIAAWASTVLCTPISPHQWRDYERDWRKAMHPDLAKALVEKHVTSKKPEPRATPEHLKAVRKHFALTQQQLADHLGVTRVTLNRWENGVTAVPKNMLLTLRGLVAELKEKRKILNEENQ